MTAPRNARLEDLGPAARDQATEQFAAETRAMEDPKLVNRRRRKPSTRPRAKETKPRAQPEQWFQKQLVQRLAEMLSDDVIWYHVPNAAIRGQKSRNLFKAMGGLAGVPDLTFHWSGPDWLRPGCTRAHTGFLELKAGEGKLTSGQEDFLAATERMGHGVAVVRTIDDALGTLRRWGVPFKAGAIT